MFVLLVNFSKGDGYIIYLSMNISLLVFKIFVFYLYVIWGIDEMLCG